MRLRGPAGRRREEDGHAEDQPERGRRRIGLDHSNLRVCCVYICDVKFVSVQSKKRKQGKARQGGRARARWAVVISGGVEKGKNPDEFPKYAK